MNFNPSKLAEYLRPVSKQNLLILQLMIVISLKQVHASNVKEPKSLKTFNLQRMLLSVLKVQFVVVI